MTLSRYRGITYLRDTRLLFFLCCLLYISFICEWLYRYSGMRRYSCYIQTRRGPGKGKMATSLYRIPRVRIQGSTRAIRIGRHGLALTPYRIAILRVCGCVGFMFSFCDECFLLSFCGECLELSLRFPGIRGFGPYAGEVLPKFSRI